MKYCIDTSALLDAWVRWYPPDLFPSLWQHVEKLTDEDEELCSCEDVFEELSQKAGDDIHAWAAARQNIFIPLDDAIQAKATAILDQYPRLVDTRKGKSLADPFVIATAVEHNLIVVTGEKPTRSIEKPKIPDVCVALRVECIDFVELIRREKWRF